MEYCRKATQEKRNHSLDYRMIAADGRVVWLHNLVNVIVEHDEPSELVGVMVDITDRKKAETALKDLTGRLINAQEGERRRIARELHDGLSQQLALLSVRLEQLSQHLPMSSSGIQEHVHDMRKQIREISTDVHRLSHQLHPSKLEHLGIVTAINRLCRELSQQYGVHIGFHNHEVPALVPRELALCL